MNHSSDNIFQQMAQINAKLKGRGQKSAEICEICGSNSSKVLSIFYCKHIASALLFHCKIIAVFIA